MKKGPRNKKEISETAHKSKDDRKCITLRYCYVKCHEVEHIATKL